MARRIRQSSRLGRDESVIVAGLGYAALLLGAALGGAASETIRSMSTPVLLLGLAVALIGLIGYAVDWLKRQEWDVASEERFDRTNLLANYGPGKLPRPGDVDRVIRFATENVPAEYFYSAEMLNEYIAVNPGALRCIRGDRLNPQRITGYYILLALSERAEGLIRDGTIDVGVALAPKLTVENPRNATAFYIGMVHGLRGVCESEAALALAEHLDQLHEENGCPVRVYARMGHRSSGLPMTEGGFIPLSSGERGRVIEVLEYPNPDAVEQLRRRQEWQKRLVARLSNDVGRSVDESAARGLAAQSLEQHQPASRA